MKIRVTSQNPISDRGCSMIGKSPASPAKVIPSTSRMKATKKKKINLIWDLIG
jgi:hypothetical protein